MGSVEDPTVGVIVEFEAKKHKIRVLQVERGVRRLSRVRPFEAHITDTRGSQLSM